VQVRRAQPNAIERRRKVTVRIKLGHRRPIDSHLFDAPIGFFSGGLGPGMRALGIGADLRNGNHLVRALAARLVAGGAVAQVDFPPFIRQLRIDRMCLGKWPGWWR